jgi:hypothetical protein
LKSHGAALLGIPPASVDPTVLDLLTFWISPNAMAVRKKVGLL